MFSSVIVVTIYILGWIMPSAAYSWKLNGTPQQCADISITITGSDGQPPYNVLVAPYGPLPWPNKIDVRGVIQKSFKYNSSSIHVPIKYPAYTQFVAVVSDSAGFGTGGTSAATLVSKSGNSSCFNASHPWTPHFWFFIGHHSQATEVVQCNTTRIWWNHTANVEGTPSFVGVIPGDKSFPISPDPGITNTSDEGIGFSWLPRIHEGTELLIIGGDSRGLGTGGSMQFTIGHSDDSSCLKPGNVKPTTVASAVPSAVAPRPNMTPIIGGAVGGSLGFVALGAIIALFIRHRRKYPYRKKVYPLQDITEPVPRNLLLQSSIEPFTDQDPRISTTIIQYVDGGPCEAAVQDIPTIRTSLPPSYDSLAIAHLET